MKKDQDPDKNQEIFDKIIQKDPDTINKLFPELSKRIKLFLLKKEKYSRENVHDLVCETLIVAIQKKGIKLTCSYITYLMAIAKNIWMNGNRKIKEIPMREEELEFIAAVKRIFVESEDYNSVLLDNARSKLTDKEIELLYYHVNDYDHKSAAKNMKYKSVGVYNTMKLRTVKKLKKLYFYLVKNEEKQTRNDK